MPSRQSTGFPLLFTPLTLRGHELRNRVVFTAHTASFSQDGVPGPRARAYYEARAAGGAAMIVMEPLPVLPSGGVTPQNYRFGDDRFKVVNVLTEDDYLTITLRRDNP